MNTAVTTPPCSPSSCLYLGYRDGELERFGLSRSDDDLRVERRKLRVFDHSRRQLQPARKHLRDGGIGLQVERLRAQFVGLG